MRSLDTGQFAAVNRAFEALTGYSRKEILGKRPDDLALFGHPHHERNVTKVVLGETITNRGSIRRKDGTIVEVVFSATMTSLVGEGYIIAVLQPNHARDP